MTAPEDVQQSEEAHRALRRLCRLGLRCSHWNPLPREKLLLGLLQLLRGHRLSIGQRKVLVREDG